MYEPFRPNQRVKVKAFEDLPEVCGVITEVGEDYINIIVSFCESIASEPEETFIELYEEQWHLVSVYPPAH
jgi:hypothetical protein